MKAKIVQIGNSKGIRLPKTLLEQTGISTEVQLEATRNSIVIRPARKLREGWENWFMTMAERGDDQLLDSEGATRWDKDEWEWK